MGGHHEPEIQIPDYRIYKVDNVPELVKVKNILATEGLKDPWLR
jgi:NADH dehydrogenase (ubiquinone) 1 beta subcomplex subunit 3